MPTRIDRGPGKRAPCPSCGVALLGEYCQVGGERRTDPRRDRIVACLMGPLRALGSVESCWPRALWSLVRRPGELAVEWARGARVRWPRPWSILLLINLVYDFVAQQLHIGLLRTPLAMQLSGSPWSRDVAPRIASRGLTLEDIQLLRPERGCRLGLGIDPNSWASRAGARYAGRSGFLTLRYARHMKRTNLVLDEQLLEDVLRMSGERTYSAAVSRALTDFIKRARAGRILELAGSGLWEGDLGKMRDDPQGPKKKGKRGSRAAG